MQLDPVTWAIAMKPGLFYEITGIWPCSYYTNRCVLPDPSDKAFRGNLDLRAMSEMTDAMRQGKYLLIDGQKWNVVLDDGIFEDNHTTHSGLNGGQFASDIYFIPLTYNGGSRATYWEYHDFQTVTMPNLADGRFTDWFWSDSGRWLWAKMVPRGYCLAWESRIEPRVILRTPQLAGRILHVAYTPLQHTRDPYPDEEYYVGGGVGERGAPSQYSDWNPPA